ncbi:M48 family metallopeptidase [Ascidiimonas aurantiaca]|uniref:M48 family metallopeptidase n=1 Tax=Ascidiimonas aurantiaca TaxID=1685432 RepID=UPI0030ECD7B7
MTPDTLFYIVIAILVIEFIADQWLGYLNARRFNAPVPEELKDLYDAKEYRKSQQYQREQYRFGLVSSGVSFALMLGFLIFGGFGYVDNLARSISPDPIIIALLFFGILIMGSSLLTLPFSWYHTFVIENKYGFNTTTRKTFIADKIKGWILMAILGGGMLALIMKFYEWAGTSFWLYAWALLALFSILANMFYSRLIVPLFNKQTPLEEGSLKTAIEAYASRNNFELDKIFVIDGSKRSTKANAHFSGFGKQKRIALYDTLINDLETPEIVSVLAHEVGHYKKNHILFNLLVSLLLTGVTFYILSVFINYQELSLAIGVETPGFHAALLTFGILYSPISEVTGLLMNYFSRKFEYQADAFAKDTYEAAHLISALKKLSKHSLSNLTPHPAYVFMHYSHPSLIQRIKQLKA